MSMCIRIQSIKRANTFRSSMNSSLGQGPCWFLPPCGCGRCLSLFGDIDLYVTGFGKCQALVSLSDLALEALSFFLSSKLFTKDPADLGVARGSHLSTRLLRGGSGGPSGPPWPPRRAPYAGVPLSLRSTSCPFAT